MRVRMSPCAAELSVSCVFVFRARSHTHMKTHTRARAGVLGRRQRVHQTPIGGVHTPPGPSLANAAIAPPSVGRVAGLRLRREKKIKLPTTTGPSAMTRTHTHGQRIYTRGGGGNRLPDVCARDICSRFFVLDTATDRAQGHRRRTTS